MPYTVRGYIIYSGGRKEFRAPTAKPTKLCCPAQVACATAPIVVVVAKPGTKDTAAS